MKETLTGTSHAQKPWELNHGKTKVAVYLNSAVTKF